MLYLSILILYLCIVKIQCQLETNNQNLRQNEFKLIAGLNSTYNIQLQQPAFIQNFNISSDQIDCRFSQKQYYISIYDSISINSISQITKNSQNNNQAAKLQHVIFRTFQQIQLLSSIAEIIYFKQKIYCLLMNSTLIIYNIQQKSNPNINFKINQELSINIMQQNSTDKETQVQNGKFIPFEKQNILLYLSNNFGFIIQQLSKITYLVNYPVILASFTNGVLVPHPDKMIIAISLVNSQLKYFILDKNNKQIQQLLDITLNINAKLIQKHKQINEEQSQQFTSQAKDYRQLKCIQKNKNIYLFALDALKGLSGRMIQININSQNTTENKTNITSISISQQMFYLDQHINRNGECENLVVSNEQTIYFSCQKVYKVNLTQMLSFYHQLIFQNQEQMNNSNNVVSYNSLASVFPNKIRDNYLTNLITYKNYLLLSTHNQLNIYWNQNFFGHYTTSNIQKIILTQNSKGLKIIMITPVSLFLLHLKTVDKVNTSYIIRFQCSSDPNLKTGEYSGKLSIKKQCQNLNNSLCLQQKQIKFLATNTKDRNILIMIIIIVVICVICIGGVIIYMLNQIRIINEKKKKMRGGKQYSSMLQEKEGDLQLQTDHFGSNKNSFHQDNDKQDSRKLKGSQISSQQENEKNQPKNLIESQNQMNKN